METLIQTIEEGQKVGRKLLEKAKGPQHIVTLSAPEKLPLYAEVIELYYTGDKFGYRALAKQYSLSRQLMQSIVRKYRPRQGTKLIMILLQSKLNDEWGEGDYQLKQESRED